MAAAISTSHFFPRSGSSYRSGAAPTLRGAATGCAGNGERGMARPLQLGPDEESATRERRPEMEVDSLHTFCVHQPEERVERYERPDGESPSRWAGRRINFLALAS
jgi:hypothetical protein